MGFMKDIRDLNKLGKAALEGYDPAQQMRDATAQMQQMSGQAAAMASGVTAPATVTGLRDTGTMINYQPVLEADVTVMPPGGVPFPATCTLSGHAIIGSVQPGATVHVRYDPANPSVVAIG